MADNNDQKNTKPSPGPIPEGWVLDTFVKENGRKVQCYLCPQTEQRFFTYKDLMRYVTYAKKAQVSIYNPNFGADTKKEDEFVATKKEGQSSVSMKDIKISKHYKG